jgi:hypothetical protein
MSNQTFNANLLNNVKNVFVAWAKAEKIDLSKNFKNREDFIKFLIAFTFKFCIENLNMSQDDALNLVLGEQTVNQLAEQVWNQVNAAA